MAPGGLIEQEIGGDRGQVCFVHVWVLDVGQKLADRFAGLDIGEIVGAADRIAAGEQVGEQPGRTQV